MANNTLYGWDLTFKTVEKDIQRKADVLIAFAHWNLTKRGFRCIGVGDGVHLIGDEQKSELLPTGWNNNEKYSLRYLINEKDVFILHGLVSDGHLILNVMRSSDMVTTNLALNIDETVKDTSGHIDKMLPSYRDLIYTIKRDLIDTLLVGSTQSAETQTRREASGRRIPDDPLMMPPRIMPGAYADSDLCMYSVARPYYTSGYYINHPANIVPRSMRQLTYSVSIREPAGLPNLGRSDLDPFAPLGGGGMIFNPFGPRRDVENPGLGIPGGLPRGAVPPGARFDPFAPIPPGGGQAPVRRPPPDADHLPPPGFDNNMFM